MELKKYFYIVITYILSAVSSFKFLKHFYTAFLKKVCVNNDDYLPLLTPIEKSSFI